MDTNHSRSNAFQLTNSICSHRHCGDFAICFCSLKVETRDGCVMMCCQNTTEKNEQKRSSPGIGFAQMHPYLNVKGKERKGDLERHDVTSLSFLNICFNTRGQLRSHGCSWSSCFIITHNLLHHMDTWCYKQRIYIYLCTNSR